MLILNLVKRLDKVSRNFEESPLKKMNQKKSLFALIVIFIGWTIHTSDSVIGAAISSKANIDIVIYATIVGSLLLVTNVFAGGFIGLKTGYASNVLARLVFGKKGMLVPNILTVVTLTGWASYSIGLSAEFFLNFIGLNSDSKVFFMVLVCLIFGIIVGFGTTIFGTKSLETLSLLTSPLLLGLLLFTVYKSLFGSAGINNVFFSSETAIMDFGQSQVSIFFWIVGITFTSWITIGLYASDYFRFAKSWKQVFITSICAFIFGKAFVQILGAIAAKSLGITDIIKIFDINGLFVVGFLVFLAASWTAVDNQIYSSSLAISNIMGISRKVSSTIVTGIAIFLAMIGIYNHLLTYLIFIGTFVGPVIGPTFADYYISKRWIVKKDYTNPLDPTIKNFRYTAILAWLSGVAVEFIIRGYGVTGINGVVTSFTTYLILEYIVKNKQFFILNK